MKVGVNLPNIFIQKVSKIFMAMILVLSIPMTAQAVNYFVATDGDNGNDCQSKSNSCLTITGAIGKASADDTIYIAAGTYTENLHLAKNLTLIGNSADTTIIDGGNIERVLYVDASVTNASLQKVTLQNGTASTAGGGIANGGTMTVDQVKVINCQSGDGFAGGGISNAGDLTISNSIISDNSAIGNTSGGGIYNYATLSLDGVILYNNSGRFGAALYNSNTATMTVTNTTISGNSGNSDSGTPFGVAIFNDGGKVTVENSTITSNTTGSDLIHMQDSKSLDTGFLNMTNVTVSSNSTDDLISAVNGPTSTSIVVNLNNCTITNNSGQIYNSATINSVNTIISNNNSGGNSCYHTLTSLGYNLESENSCGFTEIGDLVNTDPLLQPLGDYGGPTQTHALSFSSPAIDSGTNAGCPVTDQRGVTRPLDGDDDSTATCDIGSFEFDLVPLEGIVLSGSSTGLTNSLYTFTATASPPDVTLPVSYGWMATGQSTSTNPDGGPEDSVSYYWTSPGVKDILVRATDTVTGAMKQDTWSITISDGSQQISDLTLSGPTSGYVGQDYTFTASVTPQDATVPITYTWQVDDQSPVVHSNLIALTDELTLRFPDDGPHTVTVTAENSVSSMTTDHVITTSSWYVDQATGSNDNDCLSPDTACQTIDGIAGAIYKASSGHTIKIAAGTYNERPYINKDLTLIGAGINKTIIDGEGIRRGVYVTPGTTVFLGDLTVQNGADSGVGGGIINYGTLVVENILVTGNSAPSGGGGIYNNLSGALTLRNSTINLNHSDSYGGAISSVGPLTIENTTIYGNSSGGDPLDSVIYLSNTTDMTNVTISGNTQGLALLTVTGSTTTILNTTVYENSGAIQNSGALEITNSIIANNNDGGDNCLSPLSSQGYNLDSGNSCGFQSTGNLVNTDPLLQPLANNGGDTLTHALLRKSPALDSGTNTGCPTVDQRGESRPFDDDFDGTATCDIGAVEMHFDKLFPWNMFLPAIYYGQR